MLSRWYLVVPDDTDAGENTRCKAFVLDCCNSVAAAWKVVE